MNNDRGAQSVDIVLTDQVRKTLITEYQAGRLQPAGAMKYLQKLGINTGGIDRYDVATWLRSQPKEKS
jgi:hypothetical protein